MPKTSIDYSRCIIYKLCCDDPSIRDEYYGHTTDKIRRNWQHKHCCNNPNSKNYNLYVYQFIRENGNWNNWRMIVVEDYPCETKNEALRRERYWIENQQATLNKNIPTRTHQEYTQENVEKIKEKQKQYNEEHMEEIKEYQKQYNENNREEIKIKKKQYRKKNEAIIKIKHNEKFNCECGGKYTYSHKMEHLKSKKHLKYLN